MLDLKVFKIIEELEGVSAIRKYCDKANFNYRIKIQKILYLLSHSITNPIILDYNWEFYIYGPYSSELAHMIYYLFEYEELARDQSRKIEWSDKEKEIIGRFRSLQEDLKSVKKLINRELTDEKLYELIATLQYITLSILEYNKQPRNDLINGVYHDLISVKGKHEGITREVIEYLIDILIKNDFLKIV